MGDLCPAGGGVQEAYVSSNGDSIIEAYTTPGAIDHDEIVAVLKL